MPAYQSLLIYFTSGTGNTYRACAWVAEEAARMGIPTRVVPIEAAKPNEEIPQGPEGLLGLAMPTHGFTAPWHMLRFILSLPRRHGTHVFVMPTRGMAKVGSLVIPGFEGSAGYLPALILALKGYDVRGAKGVDTPASWTVVHPAFSPSAVEDIQDRGRTGALPFFRAVLSGRRSFGSRLVPLVGALLLPISLLYLLMGRFMLAKLMFASERCNGCGICARDCPVGAIRMRGDPARPYWSFACESCMRCRNFCPTQAVEASYSLGAALTYLAGIPVMMTLLDFVAGKWLPRRWFHSKVFSFVIEYPYKLLSIYLAYWLFTLLVRTPIVNRFFTYTTPTRYYGRYSEPGTRLRDLTREGSATEAQSEE
ncbi:MAG: EFR1 family ferrodoxin [Anaerolineae bacterium]